MDISDGIYTLGPESGQLLIKTSRTGLGAKAGHDLTIEVTRWQADVTLDSADAAKSSVNVEVDAGSLEVREGSGGVQPLTDFDRAEIKKNIPEKNLHNGEHPAITFRTKKVEGAGGPFSNYGGLTMTGSTQPV